MPSSDDIAQSVVVGHRGCRARRIDDHLQVRRVRGIDEANDDGIEVEVELHEHNLATLRNVSACLNLPNATL